MTIATKACQRSSVMSVNNVINVNMRCFYVMNDRTVLNYLFILAYLRQKFMQYIEPYILSKVLVLLDRVSSLIPSPHLNLSNLMVSHHYLLIKFIDLLMHCPLFVCCPFRSMDILVFMVIKR